MMRIIWFMNNAYVIKNRVKRCYRFSKPALKLGIQHWTAPLIWESGKIEQLQTKYVPLFLEFIVLIDEFDKQVEN